MDSINLTINDDRLGTVDAQNNLIYPAVDVFGSPIPVRSAVQVLWIGSRFVCFPASATIDSVRVVIAPEGVNPVGDAVILESIDAPAPDVTTIAAGETGSSGGSSSESTWTIETGEATEDGIQSAPVDNPEPPKPGKKRGR